MFEGRNPIPPEIEAPLSEFLLKLIQALLKSSYYDPSHPKSLEAKRGIYDHFKKVISHADEITIYRKTTGEGSEEAFVEVPPADPVEIKKILKSEQAQMFVPKYVAVFERKKLVSASFKKDLTEEEFIGFIEVTAEYMEEGKRVTAEDIANAFIKRNVIHVTLVFEDEVIGTRRKLPWKVELALSRLRKDLKVLPLFRDKSREEILEIKRLVLRDIIRPFREAHLLSRLLGNIDLAQTEVESFLTQDLESEIVQLLPSDVIPDLAIELANLLVKAQELVESSEAQQIVTNVKKVLPLVISRLIKEHPSRWEIYQELLNKGLIKKEDLPRAALAKIEARELTQQRLSNWEAFLEELRRAQIDEFVTIGEQLLAMSEELEKRKAFKEIAALAEVLHDKAESHPENPAFTHIARNVLKALGKQKSVIEAIKEVIENMEEGEVKPQEAVSIIRGMASLGGEAYSLLINALENTPSPLVKKTIIQALAEKKDSLPHVLRALKEPGRSPSLRRDLLFLLGELKAKLGEDTAAKFLRDPDPKVREAALQALASMGSGDLHKYVASALKDPSHIVKARALFILPLLRVVNPDIYQGAINALEDEKIPLEAKETAIRTFAKWGNKKFPDGETTEEKLLKVTEKILGSSLKKTSHGEALLKHLAELLTSIGGKKTRKFFTSNLTALPPMVEKAVVRLLQRESS